MAVVILFYRSRKEDGNESIDYYADVRCGILDNVATPILLVHMSDKVR